MKRSIAQSERVQNKKLKPTPTSTSASSSAADLAGKYDVFLSFRGTDTRHGFTDYLYHDLVGAGIRTFRDNEELHIGEEIGPDLIKAIEDSKISIPIFSKNYADSKWCLRELAHIVKCQGKIFPIFYDVDVYHVKNQKGSYKKAFQQHEKNFDKETVKDWREALKTVGKLKGYELETETNGHEGELVKKIVRNILLELKTNYEDVPDKLLVGMDHHVQEMTRSLQVDYDGARIVGIHGMGGIGKTTIAKVIYNQLCDSFDGCCFLEDVRESVKQHPSGLVDLQKQLVSKILKQDLPIIGNVYDGIKKIKDAVHGKKVLIVLDDVDEKSQFDKLAGECDWFHKASRIIITTRNKEVLNALEATCSGKGLLEAYRDYEPEFMTTDYSLKLFSKCAFMRDSPPEDYIILSQKIVSTAAGLPLVLVTLGSLFLGIRDKASWSAKFKKLEKVPDKDVMGKLRISFDALDDDNKKIFLDIACLFIGEDKAMPYYMWEDCEFVPEDGINTLVLRSLIKVGDDNTLRMHDQLRDLGRQIIREENLYKFSRMWRPEEALKVLEGGLGVENVEALNLDLSELKLDEYEQLTYVKQEYEQLKNFEGEECYVRRLKGQSFSRLQNLRFLRLGCVILDKDFDNLFSNLRWLEWKCYKKFMPTNLNMENLVILDLSHSTITDEWEGWTALKAAKKLKVLNLSQCLGLIRGPNFSMFKDLDSLTLQSCRSLIEVSGLDRLESLTYLNMHECNSIVRLPDLSNLRSLKTLDAEGCVKLREIEGLSGLVSLETLTLLTCILLEKLPDLSNLKSLKTLDIGYCVKLREIEGLSGLVSLETLELGSCWLLEKLPDLSNLKSLKTLGAVYCTKLREIEGLSGLVSLETLDLWSCSLLEKLPDLSNLKSLKTLEAEGCKKLREIEGLSRMVSLETLNLWSCSLLEKLPDLSNLKSLKTLGARGWEKLREIEGLSGLVSLENLCLSRCSLLEKLPDLSNLKSLKTLDAGGCVKLREIEGLSGLVSLETLDLMGCSLLEKLPDLSNLKSLKTLGARGCEKLREIEGLSGLVSLVDLNLWSCSLLEKFPDLSNLKSLKTLRAGGCDKLREIEGLSGLVSLEILILSSCSLLEKLPDLSNLKSLKTLVARGCDKLREIEGLEELKKRNCFIALDGQLI